MITKSKAFFILFIMGYLICSVSSSAHSEQEGSGVFSSRFCTISYEDDVDLNVVNRRLNLKFADFYSPRRFTQKPDSSTQDILSEKLDAIFVRVEDILDMHSPRIHVAINIYKTIEGLDAAYEDIFHEPNTAVSFYVYKTNTIYTTERGIKEDILAHEMAHCIIDHYFVILPPRKIQEMLAAYADVHLKD